MDKAVNVTLVVYYHFLPSELSFTSERMHRGHANALQYLPAVSFVAVNLHLSLNHMMNRKQPLSLVVIGCLGRETLTSCILSKHNTTIPKQSIHKSACSTINIHIFKGALHIFYTLKSVYLPWEALFSLREQSEKVTLMMSPGVIFSYLSLGLDSAFFNDKLVLQTGIRSLKGASIY